jgi:hypothetical protein
MTEEELQEKEMEVINKYLGDEARKLSTGQVMKSIDLETTKNEDSDWRKFGTGMDVTTITKEISNDFEDLYEIGKKLQEAIKPYRYMLEEGNVVEYLQTVGGILFGKQPDTGAPRSEVKH